MAKELTPAQPQGDGALRALKGRLEKLSLDQLSVLVHRLQQAANASSTHEPIAIVGMACRLPGGSDSPDLFWEQLTLGRSCTRPVPDKRWSSERFCSADPDAPGRTTMRRGGFITSVDDFDAEFFGMAPAEAVRTDPQQRLFLEVVWEALQDAGIPIKRLEGTATGVFVGVSSRDYAERQRSETGVDGIDAHSVTGEAISLIPGRVAYSLGLRGPAMVVDTACSSSLVALHLACQSLRAGETDLAIAGGVHLMLAPDMAIGLSKAGVLSPDDVCRSFDARANGYVRGEGVGAVVLRPLSEALRRGEPVLALIRSTAVCQDGRSNGLKAPNGGAIEALVERCLTQSGLTGADIDYVEAHGTGTPVGDMIEVQALGNVIGRGRERPCPIGSVKPQIGHLEAASGIASLIKMVLSLKNGRVPATLNFSVENAAIPFGRLGLSVAKEWCRLDTDASKSPTVSINCLSWCGTNAHTIIQAHRHRVSAKGKGAGEGQLLLLSARSHVALRELAHRYWALLSSGKVRDEAFSEICASAARRRDHLPLRLAVVAASIGDAVKKTHAFLEGGPMPGILSGEAKPRRPKLFFNFIAPPSAIEPRAFRAWLSSIEELATHQATFGSLFQVSCRMLGLPNPLSASLSLEGDLNLVRCVLAVQMSLSTYLRTLGVEPQTIVAHGWAQLSALAEAGWIPVGQLCGALSGETLAVVSSAQSRKVNVISRVSGKAVEVSAREWSEPVVKLDAVALPIALAPDPTKLVVSLGAGGDSYGAISLFCENQDEAAKTGWPQPASQFELLKFFGELYCAGNDAFIERFFADVPMSIRLPANPWNH